MAVSAGVGFDIDDIVKKAGLADKELEKMVKHSEQLEKNMREAFSAKDNGKIDRYVRSIQNMETSLNNISNNRVLLNVDDTKLKSAEDALGRIVQMVNEVARNSGRMSLLGNGETSLKEINEINAAIRRFYETQDREMNRIQGGGSSNTVLAQMRDYYREQERLARENAQKLIEIENRKNAEISRRVAEFDRWGNKAGRGGSTNSELSQMRDYYREQERLSKEAHDKEIARNREQIKQIERRIDIQRRWDERRAKREEAQRGTYQGALDYSREAKSLNDIKKALDYLDKARRRENLQTEVGERRYRELTAELNRQQSAYNRLAGEVKKSSHGMMDIVGRLGSALAAVFSIQQIKNYVNQLISVRGEFELQKRSLEAILQSKDEANEIWDKTVDLAIRSPFRIGELVKYTKQLAAYRIESDKLYDTNKMLADISSGLGVDMNRLILAFGQVKAANYLRGTELRQFSEAGVNLLEELAEQFSKVEGRAVSVGDVFERVSKRMVSFEDVETVLKKITSKGGVFYNMQEIQAETLKGMTSNLRDNLDVMFNEIGQKNDGVIKGSISLLRKIADNWKGIAAILNTILIPLMTYKTLSFLFLTNGGALLNLAVGIERAYVTTVATVIYLRKGIAAARTYQKGFNAAAASNVYVAAAAVIIAVITAIWQGIKRAREEQVEFNRITGEGFQDAQSLAANYKRLANEAVNAADGSKEQEEALAELERTYKDLLPAQAVELEYLREMAGSYDAVTTSIYAKIEAQTREKLMQNQLEDEMEDLVETEAHLVEWLEDRGMKKSDAQAVIAEFKRRINEGELLYETPSWLESAPTGIALITSKFGDAARAAEDLNSIIDEYFGEEGHGVGKVNAELFYGSRDFNTAVQDYLRAIGLYKEEVDRIKGVEIEEFKPYSGGELYQSLEEDFKSFTKTLSDSKDGYIEEGEMMIVAEKEWQDASIKQLNDYKAQLEEKKKGALPSEFVIYDTFIENIDKEIKKIEGSGTLKKINDLRYNISERMSVDLGALGQTKMNGNEGVSAYAKRIDELAKEYEANVKALNNPKITSIQRDDILGNKTVEQYTREAEALRAYADSIWLFENKTEDKEKKKTDRRNKLIQERINLYKEMNSEYEKLAKYMSAEEAEEAIRESYEPTAKRLGVDISKDFGRARLESIKEEIDFVNELNEAYKKFLAEGLSEEEAKKKLMTDFDIRKRDRDVEKWIEEIKETTRKEEGLKLEAYRNKIDGQPDVWTIGYGFTKDVKEGDTMTFEEAEARLDKEVRHHIKALKEAMENGLIDLNKNQFMALADLAYQAGPGAVQKILREAKGDMDYIAEKLKSAGTTIKGVYTPSLQGRADRRVELFLKEVDEMELGEDGLIKVNFDEQLSDLDKQLKSQEMLAKQIRELQSFGDQGTIKALEYMMSQARSFEEYLAIQKAVDNYKAKIYQEIAEKEREALKKETDSMFEAVELTKELQKIGFSEELAKTFNFEFLDIDTLKIKLMEMKDAGRFDGEDNLKLYNQYLEKINNMEVKATRERMKTYSKYLLEGMSNRVKLKIEEMRKLKEIEELAESIDLDDKTRKKMERGVTQESNKSMQKQEWEDFKNSEMYTLMFEDIEHMGSVALETLQKKLESLKGSLTDLDASEVKEIIGQINKIEDEMISRNPFAYMKELRKEMKGMKSEEEYQVDLINAQNAEADAQKIIDAIDSVQHAYDTYGILDGEKYISEEDLALYTIANAEAIRQGKTLEQIREEKEGIVATEKENVQAAQKGLNTYKRADKTLAEQKDAWGEIGGKLNDVFDVAKELMTTLGVSTDSVAYSLVESAQGMGDLIMGAVQFGLQMEIAGYQANAALGVIGWILIAIQLIVKLLSAIFSAKDKALEKQMEEHLATVERLQEAYDKLETAIDEAYSTKQLERYARETQKLTAETIRAQEAAIAANKARKQTDEVREQTAEMEKELAALKEQEKETLEDLFSSATDGILDSVADAARDFVDAWYDAFIETGDGLKGLEENFKETMINMLKQQAALQIVGPYVADWVEDLKKYINPEKGDTTLTKEEAKAWFAEVEKEFPEISAALENLYSGIKGWEKEVEGGELSALQKGIQGATAEQAEVISSYLNSIRMYVATNGETLKSQLEYTKKIFTLLDDRTKNNSQAFNVRLVQ